MPTKPPPAGLIAVLIAGALSLVIVLGANAEACLSESGVCILATPAFWVYWMPLFVVLWLLTGLVMRARGAPSVFPSPRLEKFRETPYLRTKGQGAVGVVAGVALYELAIYGLDKVRPSLAAESRAMVESLLDLLRNRIVGFVIVMTIVIVVVKILERVQDPVE